jgi:hypothetical protein
VKHASLITGVSEGYYTPVLDRNPHLKKQAITAAMPYGGEELDHKFVRGDVRLEILEDRCETLDVRGEEIQRKSFNPSILQLSSTPSTLKLSSTFQLPQPPSTFNFIYAGALLPKAIKPLEKIFESLASLHPSSPTSHVSSLGTNVSGLTSHVSRLSSNVSFHFIGTANKVKPLAEKYGLWNSIVFEHPDRIPYLEVLKNLEAADGIFILGSTEPHYTPSKVYQAVLSKKPILAVLHESSSAVNIIIDSKAGIVVTMNGEENLNTLGTRFRDDLDSYLLWTRSFNPADVNKHAFIPYTAESVTKVLIDELNKLIK